MSVTSIVNHPLPREVEVKPVCPSCNSVDTVSYWDIKANQGGLSAIYRKYYPNARACVDCEYVWWKERTWR